MRGVLVSTTPVCESSSIESTHPFYRVEKQTAEPERENFSNRSEKTSSTSVATRVDENHGLRTLRPKPTEPTDIYIFFDNTVGGVKT